MHARLGLRHDNVEHAVVEGGFDVVFVNPVRQDYLVPEVADGAGGSVILGDGSDGGLLVTVRLPIA